MLHTIRIVLYYDILYCIVLYYVILNYPRGREHAPRLGRQEEGGRRTPLLGEGAEEEGQTGEGRKGSAFESVFQYLSLSLYIYIYVYV